MFKLVSKYGNAIKETNSERKRDQLVELGYKLIPEKKEPTEKKAATKTASAKRGTNSVKREN